MKLRLPLIVAGCIALFATVSCKKAIEKKQQDMLMDAITSGLWIVEQYIEGPDNISNQFLHYTFKFNENGTVVGTREGVSATGTWAGSIADLTITSAFPTAGDPLQKLNGVWKIKDSGWEFVKAEMPGAKGTNTLYLSKQ
jgi:hypothetical protein